VSIRTLLRAVFAVKNRKLGEDTHVRALEAETGLKQRHDLVEVTTLLVLLEQHRQLLRMNNDVETANLCKAELFLLETRKLHLLPDLCVARLARAFDRSLSLPEVDERCCETGPVVNAAEQELGRLVELVLEALFANAEDVRYIGQGQELLHVVEAVGLGVRVRKLGIDPRLAERLAGHLKVADEIVMFAGMVRDLDDFGEVGRILRLDVRI